MQPSGTQPNQNNNNKHITLVLTMHLHTFKKDGTRNKDNDIVLRGLIKLHETQSLQPLSILSKDQQALESAGFMALPSHWPSKSSEKYYLEKMTIQVRGQYSNLVVN